MIMWILNLPQCGQGQCSVLVSVAENLFIVERCSCSSVSFICSVFFVINGLFGACGVPERARSYVAFHQNGALVAAESV